MRPDQIILNPHVTEKTTAAEGSGKYTFKVLSRANKTEIKKAVEKIFSTKVERVNIIKTKAKTRRRGRTIGIVGGFKKAIVTLKKGEKIKLKEEKKEKKAAVKSKEIKKEKTKS